MLENINTPRRLREFVSGHPCSNVVQFSKLIMYDKNVTMVKNEIMKNRLCFNRRLNNLFGFIS